MRAIFSFPLPPCHLCLQSSALPTPQGGFVSNVPQWDPLTLLETLKFASDFDFWRGFFNFLSLSEVHGVSTKPTRGVIKMPPWAGPVLLSCAGLLGWRELSWQAGSAAERQLCPGAAPLQSAAGLRALPAGTEGRLSRKREVKGSVEWEDAESSKEEKPSQPLTW